MESVIRIMHFIILICNTDIVEQQNIMTARTIIKFKLAKVRHGVLQDSVLGPLLFLLCI